MLESRITPRYFWDAVWLTLLLLKFRRRWFIFLVFLLTTTSWAYFLESGLKLVFHWYAQLLLFTKSSFNSFLVALPSWITENNDASSANNLAFDETPFGKSLMHWYKFEKCWYNTIFWKKGLWKCWKLLSSKHTSGSIKSLREVYVWSNVCIVKQDSV